MDIQAPEPRIDANPDEGEAAGGVDAVTAPHPPDPVIPEPPISAQLDQDEIPDEVEEPEEPDTGAQEAQPQGEETGTEPTG